MTEERDSRYARYSLAERCRAARAEARAQVELARAHRQRAAELAVTAAVGRRVYVVSTHKTVAPHRVLKTSDREEAEATARSLRDAGEVVSILLLSRELADGYLVLQDARGPTSSRSSTARA